MLITIKQKIQTTQQTQKKALIAKTENLMLRRTATRVFGIFSLIVFPILSVWHGNSNFNAQGTKCQCKSLPDMSNLRVGLASL